MLSNRMLRSPVKSSPNMFSSPSNMLSTIASIPTPIAARKQSLPIPIRQTVNSARSQDSEKKSSVVRRACTTSSPGQQLEAMLASEMANGLGQLQSDVCKAKMSAEHKSCVSNLKFVAGILASYGYTVKLRSGRDSQTSTDYLTKLKHTFIVVSGGIPQYQGPEVIIELDFNDHFEVAKPTQRYSKFLGHVPDVLVVTTDTMEAILQLVHSEMEMCFDSQGLFIPPWRMLSSVSSKWLPRRFSDVCVMEEILSESDGEDAISPTSVLDSSAALAHFSIDKHSMRDLFASRDHHGRMMSALGV